MRPFVGRTTTEALCWQRGFSVLGFADGDALLEAAQRPAPMLILSCWIGAVRLRR